MQQIFFIGKFLKSQILSKTELQNSLPSPPLLSTFVTLVWSLSVAVFLLLMQRDFPFRSVSFYFWFTKSKYEKKVQKRIFTDPSCLQIQDIIRLREPLTLSSFKWFFYDFLLLLTKRMPYLFAIKKKGK